MGQRLVLDTLFKSATVHSVPSQAPPSLSRTILRNLVALTSGQFSERIISMVTAAYLARTLGPTGLGVTVYSLAVAGYLTLVVGAGLDVVAGRAVTRHPLAASTWTSHTLTLRTALALVAYLALIACGALLPWSPLQRTAILVAGSAAFANALQLDWLYQAQDRMHIIALRKALAQLVTLASVLVLVRSQSDVLPAVACPVIGLLFGVLWVLRTSKQQSRWTWLRPDIRFVSHALKAGLPVFLSGVMILTYQQFAVLLLARYNSLNDVGIYGASLKVYAAIGGLQILVNTSIYPTFCRLAGKSGLEQGTLLRITASAMHAVGALVAMALIAAAHPLLTQLFGNSYGQGAPVLQILAIAQFLVFNQCVTSPFLYATGRQAQHLVAVSLGAAINVACNLWLVPLHGPIGSAWAMVLSEIVVFCAMYFFVRRALANPIPNFLSSALGFCLFGVIVVAAPPGGLRSACWIALTLISISPLPRLLAHAKTLHGLRLSEV